MPRLIHVSTTIDTKRDAVLLQYCAGHSPWTHVIESRLDTAFTAQCPFGFCRICLRVNLVLLEGRAVVHETRDSSWEYEFSCSVTECTTLCRVNACAFYNLTIRSKYFVPSCASCLSCYCIFDETLLIGEIFPHCLIICFVTLFFI